MSRDRLWAWAQEEEDDASERAAVAAHVESCAECRAQVDDMRGLLDDLGAVAEIAVAQGPMPIPETIGDYRVIRRIGRGGMGVVYEAEQREPKRRVAVKVIVGGQHVSDVQRRLFQREVQTLARLNHPSIAAIYEAGRTDDGNPFFAMELVEGRPLTEFVAPPGEGDTPMALDNRLALFGRICDGIRYAHQRGIIHRDLKPGNILVATDDDGIGRPKILDFGLARIVAGEEGDAPVSMQTEGSRLLGTLPYMSPEQVQRPADELDTRSDVYSLGVVLYEMLTGSLPYNVSRMSLVSAARVICEQRPASPRAVDPEIPDDVATIVLKALEKEPDRRYVGVDALAEDIARYLAGHPILARPASTAYHLRKWIARHKAPSALAALLALSVIVGGTVSFVQARRISKKAAELRRVVGALQALYVSADWARAGDRQATVIDTIDQKAPELEAELSDDPLVAAAVRNAIGNTYASYAKYPEAELHLVFAYETRLRELGEANLETATSMNDFGELRYHQGQFDDAEQLWRRALAVRRGEAGTDSAEAAETLNNLGNLMRRRDRLDEGRRMLEEALRVRRRLLARVQTDRDATEWERRRAWNDTAQTINNLAGLMRDRGGEADLEEAERLYREALRMREDSLGADHPEAGKVLNNLAKLLEQRGDVVEAEQRYQRALEILRSESGLGNEHQYIARLLVSIARLRLRLGDAPEARQLAEEALAMQVNLLGESHQETQETRALIAAMGTSQSEEPP